MSNTWVELDLGILSANIRSLRKVLAPKSQIIFVVKANAYGHGMPPVARQAWKSGVRWFAVAHIEEALALRKILPGAKIIIVGAIDPKDTTTAIKHKLIPVIVNAAHAAALGAAATRAKAELRCHVKIDTGMGRLGFAWQEAGSIVPALARRKGLDVCGICSHFASVGAASRRDIHDFAHVQADRFRKVIAACEKSGMTNLFKHISNSGGIVCDSAWHFDGVRPGILLYGYGKTTFCPRPFIPRPILSWKTRILQIKKVPAGFPVSYDSTYVTKKATNIATIDVGYSDGYHRALSNKGIVVVGGKRCRVVGRVTMNLVMIDLGPATRAREHDEVVLIGSQGKASVRADELGSLAGTISYEILTSIRTDERRLAAGT